MTVFANTSLQVETFHVFYTVKGVESRGNLNETSERICSNLTFMFIISFLTFIDLVLDRTQGRKIVFRFSLNFFFLDILCSSIIIFFFKLNLNN